MFEKAQPPSTPFRNTHTHTYTHTPVLAARHSGLTFSVVATSVFSRKQNPANVLTIETVKKSSQAAGLPVCLLLPACLPVGLTVGLTVFFMHYSRGLGSGKGGTW